MRFFQRWRKNRNEERDPDNRRKTWTTRGLRKSGQQPKQSRPQNLVQSQQLGQLQQPQKPPLQPVSIEVPVSLIRTINSELPFDEANFQRRLQEHKHRSAELSTTVPSSSPKQQRHGEAQTLATNLSVSTENDTESDDDKYVDSILQAKADELQVIEPWLELIPSSASSSSTSSSSSFLQKTTTGAMGWSPFQPKGSNIGPTGLCGAMEMLTLDKFLGAVEAGTDKIIAIQDRLGPPVPKVRNVDSGAKPVDIPRDIDCPLQDDKLTPADRSKTYGQEVRLINNPTGKRATGLVAVVTAEKNVGEDDKRSPSLWTVGGRRKRRKQHDSQQHRQGTVTASRKSKVFQKTQAPPQVSRNSPGLVSFIAIPQELFDSECHDPTRFGPFCSTGFDVSM